MPTYHFNVNGDFVSDPIELLDIADAKREAMKLAGRIVSEELSEGFWINPEWTMTVTNGGGVPLFRLMFLAANAQ